MKRGLEFAAVKLQVPVASFYEKTEGCRIMQDFSAVHVNGCRIEVEGIVQAVSVMVLCFISFNLQHSISYKDVIELLESLVGVRKIVSKHKVRNLLTLL